MNSQNSKSEAIKAAYGELYDSKTINKDGWQKYPYHKPLYDKDKFESKQEGQYFCIRPKSLSGIENNRGWTRIESEEDLPKYNSAGDFYVMSNEGNKVLLNGGNAVRNAYRLKTITHWQLIETKPPIF